ncbi:hypothetical protein Plhal710r2_c069g0177291 [Plasmopara halstedii]
MESTGAHFSIVTARHEQCGAVCLSYEIVMSMLLEMNELLVGEDELVIDVVDKARTLARVEAQLGFC